MARPGDELCPPAFREAVAKILPAFAEQVRSDRKLAELSQVGWSRWNRLTESSWQADHAGSWADMRYALLDFVADFSNWDASTVPAFLETSEN
jgi:putative DNA methylase